MNTNPFILGIIRGVGYPTLMLLLTYISDINHLAGSGLSLTVATIIAGLASAFEHQMEAKTGKAMFGAIRAK